jgi:hypothetical protein
VLIGQGISRSRRSGVWPNSIIPMTTMPAGVPAGRHEDTCNELQAISPELGMLRRWEETQLERHHDQLKHGLPDDHREVMRVGGSYLRRGRYLASLCYLMWLVTRWSTLRRDSRGIRPRRPDVG